MEDNQAKAFEMFGEGKSVNAVAAQLFKNNWAKAKALKDAYDAQGGGGG